MLGKISKWTEYLAVTRIFVFLICCAFTEVSCLRDVVMTIPEAVPAGDSVILRCHYDLEDDTLYTVKWYRGRSEFFRYVPKELPHTRTFPGAGLSVDESKSGPNQVVLVDLRPSMSGRYKCEVSADAPSFDTAMVGGYLTVIDLPDGPPDITVEKKRYSAGDILKARCVSLPTSPSTNLTWYINDKKINKIFYSTHPPMSLNDIDVAILDKPHLIHSTDNTKGVDIVHIINQNTRDTNGINNFDRETRRGTRRTRRTPQSFTTLSPSNTGSAPSRSSVAPEKRRTKVYLELPLDANAFEDGKLRLRCTAEMYQLYRSGAEIILEEGPRLAPILATRDSGSGSIAHNGMILSTIVAVFIVLCILR